MDAFRPNVAACEKWLAVADGTLWELVACSAASASLRNHHLPLRVAAVGTGGRGGGTFPPQDQPFECNLTAGITEGPLARPVAKGGRLGTELPHDPTHDDPGECSHDVIAGKDKRQEEPQLRLRQGAAEGREALMFM
jgi:hypothetical protein